MDVGNRIMQTIRATREVCYEIVATYSPEKLPTIDRFDGRIYKSEKHDHSDQERATRSHEPVQETGIDRVAI